MLKTPPGAWSHAACLPKQSSKTLGNYIYPSVLHLTSQKVPPVPELRWTLEWAVLDHTCHPVCSGLPAPTGPWTPPLRLYCLPVFLSSTCFPLLLLCPTLIPPRFLARTGEVTQVFGVGGFCGFNQAPLSQASEPCGDTWSGTGQGHHASPGLRTHIWICPPGYPSSHAPKTHRDTPPRRPRHAPRDTHTRTHPPGRSPWSQVPQH